jgi:hypothetical protein
MGHLVANGSLPDIEHGRAEAGFEGVGTESAAGYRQQHIDGTDLNKGWGFHRAACYAKLWGLSSALSWFDPVDRLARLLALVLGDFGRVCAVNPLKWRVLIASLVATALGDGKYVNFEYRRNRR